ncbi:MAG: hypothetical protein V1977_03180 [Candidatus Diapherotrites archaeon]
MREFAARTVFAIARPCMLRFASGASKYERVKRSSYADLPYAMGSGRGEI